MKVRTFFYCCCCFDLSAKEKLLVRSSVTCENGLTNFNQSLMKFSQNVQKVSLSSTQKKIFSTKSFEK